MPNLVANRIQDVPKSFIREILKVAADPEIISFAGGLPNPKFFPVQEIKKATAKVLEASGQEILQYSTTEGYLPLRKYISQRYQQQGIEVTAEEVLITNGSQQGLDLIARTFLNEGDKVIIEKPGYLGAIQAFSIYQPQFYPIELQEDGIDISSLKKVIAKNDIKMFYGVPNFQNPSGITYSKDKRKKIAEILKGNNVIFVEDDPYGDLRFSGNHLPSMKKYLDQNLALLGSFSKIVAPGFRLGWVCLPKDKLDKVLVAKQAADLHSNYFTQRVLYQYLLDNDLDQHLEGIKTAYKEQKNTMVAMIKKYFPDGIGFTNPTGGMFLWVTLPQEISSLELFELAIKEKVAFVPGDPFYIDEKGKNTFRLNYSNVDQANIKKGIKRLAGVLKKIF